MRRTLLTLFLLTPTAAGLAAQAARAPAGTPKASAHIAMEQRYADRLPLRRSQLQAAGVADSTISSLLDIFRGHELTPVQVDRILVTERDDARRHGPTDNFGAFVQTQLDSGKRGRALAAAIHGEHQRHGHRHDAEHARQASAKEARERARVTASKDRNKDQRPMVESHAPDRH